MGKDVLTRINELDGDVYLITQTIKKMEETLNELNSKYELLLNRVKCTECHLNNSGDKNASTENC